MSRRRARCSSSSASSSSRRLVVEEAVAAVPLAVHQRVPDEQLARQRHVDPAEGDGPVGDERYAVQRDPLVGHHRGPLLATSAARSSVRFTRCGAELLGPLRLDRGVLPAHSREVSTSSPAIRNCGFFRSSPLPGKIANRAPRAPRYSRGPALLAVALLEQPDVREQPGEQRLVDAVGVGHVGGPADLDLHLLADLAQLGLEVLPLAHPQAVEELALAHPPERRRRQLLLLLLEVAPEVEPGEEVRALGLEPRVLLVGRPAARRAARAGPACESAAAITMHLAQAAAAARPRGSSARSAGRSAAGPAGARAWSAALPSSSSAPSSSSSW